MTDSQIRPGAMSLTNIVEAVEPERRGAVVVGVDGSESNRAAVRWAAHEAEASDRPLRLVCVCGDEMPTDSDEHSAVLRRLADDIAGEHPELTVDREIAAGDPIRTLLERSLDQGLLVVGKRGHGTFARLLIGSTSIAVAGRSRVPTVIIPDTWEQSRHLHQPVVVGLDPDDVHAEALNYAFAEARPSRCASRGDAWLGVEPEVVPRSGNGDQGRRRLARAVHVQRQGCCRAVPESVPGCSRRARAPPRPSRGRAPRPGGISSASRAGPARRRPARWLPLRLRHAQRPASRRRPRSRHPSARSALGITDPSGEKVWANNGVMSPIAAPMTGSVALTTVADLLDRMGSARRVGAGEYLSGDGEPLITTRPRRDRETEESKVVPVSDEGHGCVSSAWPPVSSTAESST